jgi:hypothetical protein
MLRVVQLELDLPIRNVICYHLTCPDRGGTIDASQQVTNNGAVVVAMYSVLSPALADVMI